MTNEEAIEVLQNKSCYECSFGCNSAITCECEKCDYRSASIVAIEALNTQDELCENLAWYINERQRLIKEKERPQGEWEHWGSPFSDDSIANSIVCSLCKARYVEIEDEVFNFCPNCGSDNIPRKHGCSFADEECKKNPCKDCGVKEGEAE